MNDLYLRNRELRLFEDDLNLSKHDPSLFKPTLDRFYIFLDEVTNNEDEFQPGNYRPK